MDLSEAVEKATRVLEEEQIQPTLRYRYVGTTWADNSTAEKELEFQRRQRPRFVYEDPKQFVLESTNFNLLLKIFSQVGLADRAGFVSTLLNFVRIPIKSSDAKFQIPFPSYGGHTSSLALLAEFLIRTGHLKDLMFAFAVPLMPTASLAIMLKELEEMIALNFNLFSDAELAAMPFNLSHLLEIAERQTYSARGSRGEPMQDNPHYRQGFSDVGNEIVKAIVGIVEQCRKARFWYLKGALQDLPNLEIESDKLKVEDFLTKLGFHPDMVKVLNAAESDYKSTATAFELKNCLGHLRSFLEHLHRESAKSIAKASGPPVADKWGAATLYLRQQGIFTTQHEQFIIALYTLLSDESVHPLTAEREYARLLRNVVIEYGVMFLTVLDKRGVTI
jgi:hypothetical protein